MIPFHAAALHAASERSRTTAAFVSVWAGHGAASTKTTPTCSVGNSWNTVRFQLRQIYAKAQVNGQAELARMITRLELTR